MDELIRSKMHDALDAEQPAGDLRSRVLASLPVEQRPARRFQSRSFQLVGGLVAGLLALALVVGLLYSRGSISPHPAQGGQCKYLYSPGVTGQVQDQGILFINESVSSCTFKAPVVSFVDGAGNRLDVPQVWAPGASEGVVTLEGISAAAVPFSIQYSQCLATRSQYTFILATFSNGVAVRVDQAGDFCQGSRIVVSTPIPAVSCADGSFVWASPNVSARKPTC